MKDAKTKHISLVFTIVIFFILLLPFICMSFAFTERLSGGTEPVQMPTIVNNDGKFNANYLSELGDYFEYHFAFRPQLVTANSLIRNAIFHDSGTDQVICGNNGYMYYVDTLDDYFVKNKLEDFELKIIAENLKATQDYLESNGKNFCFLLAPNKNSLYPQYMPYNYIKGIDQNNFERLIPYLENNQVNYINTFDIFNNESDCLYLKEDSHWNNKGASIVSNAIFEKFKKDKISNFSWINRQDRDGDLFIMEYPSIVGTEEESYAEGFNDQKALTGKNWNFIFGNSYEDTISATKSNYLSKNNRNLYMFRDSFANALMPYLSSAYSKAVYSKLIPFDIQAAVNTESDDVLLERAERNLSFLAYKAPIMPSKVIDYINISSAVYPDETYSATIETSIDGDYFVISGMFDSELTSLIKENDNVKIYVSVGSQNSNNLYSSLKYVNEEDGNFCFCSRIFKSSVDLSKILAKVFVELNGVLYALN